MELFRLTDRTHPLFDRAMALYEAAFPVQERRDPAEHCRVLKKADYHMDLLMEGRDFLGIVLYWETADFVHLEHFSTLPQLRGQGLGTKALALLKSKEKPIILEIEPPEDELTCRRYGFYRRNGFVMNPHDHVQVKYRPNDPDVPLNILTWPETITPEAYGAFRQYLDREVAPKFR